MNTDELLEQIVDLQTRLLFQEDVIQKLDEVVISQRDQLDQVLQRVAALESQVDSLRYEKEQSAGTPDERPPHY